MQKRKKIFVIIVLFVFAGALIFWQMNRNSVEEVNTVYCRSDKDCLLYDCSSCGTKDWVLKNNKNTNCEKKIPGLLGCRCENNTCKRNYGKK